MGDEKSRAKVSVALIGVGPTWDLHYREAVQRLSARIRVRAVCDGVLMRAAAVADEFAAAPVDSPWLLTQRTDLHAWLIFDPGWFGLYPADLATRIGRPALFANTFASPLTPVTRTLQQSRDSGELLMPEFPQRFTPATTRLRELMATKLGRVRRIELVIPHADSNFGSVADWFIKNQSEAVGLFDWCSWLIGARCNGVSLQATPTGPQFELTFAPRAADAEAARATLRFSSTDDSVTRAVECERGSATTSGPTQICWRTNDEQAVETFGHERSPYEIILDQFCRRALGGLVPVPTLLDALQAIANRELALACANQLPSTPARPHPSS